MCGQEMRTTAIHRAEKISVYGFLLALIWFFSCTFAIAQSSQLQSSDSIALEEFRWTKLPVKVLVDMNQWTQQEYAVAVREALDSWIKSIWNYTNTYNDTSLATVNYLFYLNDVNSTTDYDVLISFAPDKIPPGPNTVGLTTYSWDLTTHQPVPPITINITTYSGTATTLFVKNIAMHEFGHALGLGHALPQNTLNGPELMYFSSSKNQVVYPSTLDVYGLTKVYNGSYGQTVYLPSSIPYVMLAEGDIPPPQIIPWEDYRKYTPLFIVLFLVVVVAAVLGLVSREKKPEDLQPPPPPALEDSDSC
jgi:predicted Zn-dependent protease